MVANRGGKPESFEDARFAQEMSNGQGPLSLRHKPTLRAIIEGRDEALAERLEARIGKAYCPYFAEISPLSEFQYDFPLVSYPIQLPKQYRIRYVN